MPEGPEVETIRRGLEPVLVGRVIRSAEARRPDLRRPLPERFAERLTGRRVEALERRSKYLLAALSGGETLLIHLGMSGRLLIRRPEAASAAMLGEFHHAAGADSAHDHVILTTDEGARIIYNDARRFGLMDLAPTEGIGRHPLLAALGPDPLTNAFGPEDLARAMKGRIAPVKAILLDQRRLAGVGNIYASEALWRARIGPEREGGSLSEAETEALAEALRAVLREAVAAGGSTLRDYRQADGALGYFQHAFSVYDRAGAPCPRCGGPVARMVQAGRSTFYCPACQI